MILRKNIAVFRIIVAIVLLMQMLFPFHSLFANIGGEDCAKSAGQIQKKHCCEMCDSGNSELCCSSKASGVPRPGHSFSKCDCNHKSGSANTEVTSQKSFELSKILAVEAIAQDTRQDLMSNQVQRVISFDRINGPPIYILSSIFRI